MSSPPLSILMAVRNEAEHLPAALASLQVQSERDWELVAVDDGSTDATPLILREAAIRDRRIRLLQLPPSGLVAALNAGLAACRGELVARMDGDDICHPRRLERQRAALEGDRTLDLVASRVRHFPRPGLQPGMLAYEAWQNSLLGHDAILRDLFVESPFAHPSVLFRRAAVERLGGYRDLAWAEDYDLWLRLAAAGARFAKLPETLLFWRDRPQRLTRTATNCSLAAFRRGKAHHLARTFLRGIDAVTLWGAGDEGKAWRLALAGEGIRVGRWIEVDRRKIGQIIHGAPVTTATVLQPGSGKMLITVGAKGARAEIRGWCDALGLIEGRDYCCVT